MGLVAIKRKGILRGKWVVRVLMQGRTVIWGRRDAVNLAEAERNMVLREIRNSKGNWKVIGWGVFYNGRKFTEKKWACRFG